MTPSVSAQVSGTVRDAVSDDPIEGAVVSVRASDVETTTDEAGAFELPDATGNGLTIVAGAKGYFYESSVATPPIADLELRLEPVPQVDDPWYTFQPPERCKVCHEEQYDEWFGSPMSKAGLNSWVYDIYNGTGNPETGFGGFVYVTDSAFADSNPNSECASCHQPEPWAREPGIALGDYDNPTAAMKHGVACDMCHRIADIDISKPNFPGIYPDVVTLTRPVGPNESWKVMYGVLGDVDYYQRGWMRASYQPQLRSEVCAACHQDKNDPDEDGDFETNGVISEPTYLEWLDSPYSDPSSEHYAECVDCHMPATGAAAACDRVSFTRPDGDVRSHNIVGTTPEFIENALTMTMDARIEGDSLEVDVEIENDRTGHHVPTGVTIRNMILLVEAWEVEDGTPLEYTGTQVIHDLGGCAPGSDANNCVADPDEGYYGGLPGRLYAKINIAEDGTSPTFFTDAVDIVDDNRIAALDTDTTQYSFTLPPDTDQVHVRARVIYRRSWRALVDAKQWMYDGHGEPLEDIAPPHFGHLMASAEEILGEPDMPDAGIPDGGVDGGTDSGGGGRCSASSVPRSGNGALVLLCLVGIWIGYRRRGWSPIA